MKSFLEPLLRTGAAPHQLVNTRSGRIVADQLLPALDSATRKTGLLKHTSLPRGTAMIIAPTNAIHTFFMKFPIDVAFVSRTGRVLKIRTAMPAWRMAAALRGYAVVELTAGALAVSETTVGDELALRPLP
jgi:uncharacterized membrane protein (UPF0127 family)